MTYEFLVDSELRSRRRNQGWYERNLLTTLEHLKERQARGVDKAIDMAKQLSAILNAPRAQPIPVPPHDVVPQDDDSMMKPIEPEVLELLYGAEKYAALRYLKARNRKAPEDKYFSRVVTSWDYGWRQQDSRVRPRDFNRGRCKLIRETFYRKNNSAPDPPTYALPSGGEYSVCSQYTCYAG